jgi:hypothetical protein
VVIFCRIVQAYVAATVVGEDQQKADLLIVEVLQRLPSADFRR